MINQGDSLCGSFPHISATGSSDSSVEDSVDALVLGGYRSTTLAYIPDIISSESHSSLVHHPRQMEGSEKRVKFSLKSKLSLRDGSDVYSLHSSVDMSSIATDVSRHFDTLQQLSYVRQDNKGWQSLIRKLFKKN